MKIAVPVVNGRLSAHFGHCEAFLIAEADMEKKNIIDSQMHKSPPHQPGLLPQWLSERGAEMIIASGMGQRAQDLFSEKEIIVIVGAPCDIPEKIIESFLRGDLVSGENVCDH